MPFRKNIPRATFWTQMRHIDIAGVSLVVQPSSSVSNLLDYPVFQARNGKP